MHLHPTFIDQSFEAIVQAAGADTQRFRNFTLRQVGVVLQQAQNPEVSVFLELGATISQEWLRLPRYRQEM